LERGLAGTVKSETREIETLLSELARMGRLGDYGEANRDLNACLRLIQQVQDRGAMKSVPPDLLKKFNYSLETIFLMLKNKDWVAIADIVEFELLALWQKMAKQIDMCAK
jgi:hypothetical protein